MFKYFQDFSWNYLSNRSIFNNSRIISVINLIGKVIKIPFSFSGWNWKSLSVILSPSFLCLSLLPVSFFLEEVYYLSLSSFLFSPVKSLLFLPVAIVHIQPQDSRTETELARFFSSESGLISRVFRKLVEGICFPYPPLSLPLKIQFYPFEFDTNLDSFVSLSLHQTLGFPGAIPCVPSPISRSHGYK